MSSSASPSTAPSAEYAEKTTPEKSWITWYKRVSASKKVHWDEIGIGQALALTIVNSSKDEPLMAAATYFWSNTINAFMFNQGLMNLNTKNQYDFRTKSIGGWSGYVAAYMGQGSVTPREHVAFLLMWLEKFLFCGSSCGPTTNWQFAAEALEPKREFPLGKILLGYLYQMLNNASAKIAVSSVVGAGGPWWLLQSWPNLMVMKVVNRPSVTKAEFPRLEPIVEDDGEERTHRRCMSYGEYASAPTDAGAKLSAELLKDWFCSFYKGFQKDARVWFPYEDSVDLELPSDFRFEDINYERYQKAREVFSTAISPCILPVGIHQGRNIQDPLWAVLKILSWQDSRAETLTYGGGEWKLHLFHQSASMYMIDLFPNVVPQTIDSSPPRQSNSGRDIQYALDLIPNGGGPSPPVIGYNAPKTSTLLQGLIREPADVGKKRRTRSSIVDTLALAPKKKAKLKKPKPTDDLPILDPSIEQALDEEDIEDDIDQAAAEPPPPPSPPVQQSSSDRTPSTVGSHHIEEEIQPAAPTIPALADLFSFDIKDYLDGETEEDTTSKSLVPLSDDVKKTLEDISHRLEASSLDNLVLEKAKLRLAERRELKDIEATIQANRQLVHEEKSKLDQLSEGQIKSNIDRLEAHKIELLAQLEECNAELDIEHKKLADLPKSIEEQKARLKSAIKNVADLTKSLKIIPGTDAQDA
uniref:Aminotransferase-like plant mobile domain-containing protein n=2 Tax=Oryza sativa subsp. japonica TaxID=39947 RepID=Q60DE5_ORYSJ|nr:hypothetical protein [Oryza sativa Japonica Group]ABF96793.1 hypothetical protein LOC_Os03g32000 [Oryza sativa Japonica Group]